MSEEVVESEQTGHAEPAVVRLSRDIARQFSHLPAERAAEEVATHLIKFWERRMLIELVDRVRAGDPQVDSLIVSAVTDVVTHQIDEAQLEEPSGG